MRGKAAVFCKHILMDDINKANIGKSDLFSLFTFLVLRRCKTSNFVHIKHYFKGFETQQMDKSTTPRK